MKKEFSYYSDSQLLSLLKGNKKNAEKAFTEIYNRYSPSVKAYCFCILRNKQKAEDVFQETFIKFFNAAVKDYSIENCKALLLTIARNLSLNSKRDNEELISIEELNSEIVESKFKTISNYENSELFEMILSALNILDEKYKEAFILREFDGLQYSEIAELLNTSLTNAKSRVARAKLKLIDILTPYLTCKE